MATNQTINREQAYEAHGIHKAHHPMKRLLIAIILTASLKALCGPNGALNPAYNPMNGDRTGNGALNQQTSINNAYAAMQARQADQLANLSRDPWRIVDGQTNYNRGIGWCEFQGELIESDSDGIVLIGKYGAPFTLPISPYSTHPLGDQFFFVKNYPYPIDPKSHDVYWMMAHYEGNKSRTDRKGRTTQMPELDYGIACTKTWSPEEIAAAQKKVTDHKQLVAEKALKSNEDLAAKNDPYGLMRMGERYRDGEGVDKDLAKARDYLKRAADAGEQTAADELSSLSSLSSVTGH